MSSKDIIRQYNILLEQDIEDAKARLEESKTKTYTFGRLILTHHSLYRRNPATDYLKQVLSSENGEFEYRKSYMLFVKKSIKDHLFGNLNSDDNRMMIAYMYQFKENVLEYAKAITELKELPQQAIANPTITYVHQRFNWNMGIQMLRHGIRYPVGNGFTLSIKYKHRSNRDYVGKPRQKVEWGESFKLLKLLLKDVKPELLEAYEQKEISKGEMIYQSKKYFYNAETNPNGKKWIVFDDKDFDFWLVIYKNKSKGEYAKFYGVTPVNYILTENQSQLQYIKKVTDIEDIITTKELGFRDKIVMLSRYDVSHCLNLFANDI